MSTTTKTTTALHDPPAPVRAKLAAAWTSFMFLYIYVDYFALYKPGVIDDILAGVVWEFDISQTFVDRLPHERGDPDPDGDAFHDAARPCEPHAQPRRGIAVRPLLDVQRGRRVLDVLLRPRRRARSDRPRRHPPLRLDLAPHDITIDARARSPTARITFSL